MLSWFGRRTARHQAAQVVIVGAAPEAGRLEEAARAAGSQTLRLDGTEALLTDGVLAGAGTIVLATGDTAGDLDFVRALMARRQSAPPRDEAWLVLAIVTDSQAVLAAVEDLDADAGTAQLRIRPLSPAARTARHLLRDHPFDRLSDGRQEAHPVIFGTGPAAEQLLLQLFRMMHLPKQQPRATIVAPDAAAWLDGLLASAPGLADIGAITARSAWNDDPDGVRPTAAYIVDPDIWSRSQPLPWYVPAYWLADGRGEHGATRDAVAGALWRDMAATLLHDPVDRQAQATHALYLEERRQAGDAIGCRPSMQPWASLPGRFRAASRHQADHVAYKLAAIGCRMAARKVPRFSFTAAEVDALAEAEHRRWAAVQLLEGWRYGKSRDDRTKRTPFLVPYADLPRDIQELDRLAVRGIPMQLDRTGHAVLRDLVVEVISDPGASPAAGFETGMNHLLDVLAEQYPQSAIVLRASLASSFECRAADIALQRGAAQLHLIVKDAATTAEAANSYASQAEKIHVVAPGPAVLSRPDLTLHLTNPSTTLHGPVLIALDSNGRLRLAPWL